jgi:hypothetical protein
MQSLRYVDGSYIKIKEITLSYSLPDKWVNVIKLESLECYFTARNMLTFSKLGKYDAEQEGGYKFPIQKNLIFGINVNF